MIRVLFFAELREQLDCEEIILDVSTPIAITQLREQLVQQCPHWANFLHSDKLLFACNQVMAKATQLINDGDEVAFFPPVTGG